MVWAARRRYAWAVMLITAGGLTACVGNPPQQAADPAGQQTSRPGAPRSAAIETPAAEAAAGAVVRIGGAPPILAEVAETDLQRQRGLMGRTEVPKGTGMVFRYDTAVQNAFWMYRTLVPLSIAWVADGRVVGIAEMTPCDSTNSAQCHRYVAPAPYDLAVETTGGTFTEAGVRAGDPVVIQPTPTGSPG